MTTNVSVHTGRTTLLRTLFVLIYLLPGCNVGPDYSLEEVEPEMPDAWHQDLTEGLAEGKANLRSWWDVFDDPMSTSLIERADLGNLDLQQAYARVVQAQANLGIATGEFYPNVDATGAYSRRRTSEQVEPDMPGVARTDDFYQGGFDASWEIDVFGRIRRTVESADASVMASVENYRDVQVILYAAVAAEYVQVRTLQERIILAQSNVKTQQGSLKLTQDRFDAQLVPQLDVRQAELNLASTESFIPSLRSALSAAIHRLGVLLGDHPSALYEELTLVGPIPTSPERVTVGLPAELLRQRPDIRATERLLAAQTAQIGVATADLYPRFSLVGSFNLESANSFNKMWNSNARAYSFGPSMSWNIFDGGRIRNNIKAQDALTEQALLSYEQTVLNALEEVESSMVAFAEEKVRVAALERTVVAAQESVNLVQTLYRTGLTDFQNVLDMERSLFEQQDEYATSQGEVIQDLIRLYKSLGGGWAPTDEDETATEEAAELEKTELEQAELVKKEATD